MFIVARFKEMFPKLRKFRLAFKDLPEIGRKPESFSALVDAEFICFEYKNKYPEL